MPVEPDPRWQHFIGGLSPSGEPLPMTAEILQQQADELCELVEGLDGGPSELLTQARSLLAKSWSDYDFLVQACLVSLQAVEAELRRHYPEQEKTPFRRVVDRAERDGLLSEGGADVLRTGVKVRNRLSHPDDQMSFTLGMAFPVVRTSHLLVAELAATAS